MYVAGRDRNYRPVIVVRPAVLDLLPELPSNDQIMGCICLVLEYVIRHMHLQGQIENVIMVIDLVGKGIFSIPVGVFKSIMQTIQLNYKCKSRNLFILNAPGAFTAIWNTVQYFLDENTTRKIQISSQNSHPALHDLVAPN